MRGLGPFWLVVLAALLFLPGLGARDFWAPVEPRYAEIARVMLAKGEWVTPTVNGALYTDKPIFYFWLVLLGSKLAGSVNEWTVRLPSALSGLGLVLTTYFLGREFFGSRVGFLAGLILATSARVLWEARWAHTDMAFTVFFTLSLYFFSRAVLQRGGRGEFLLAYGLMGLATLTKGLIGVVLPGLVALFFVAVRGQWPDLLRWRLPSGLLVFLLVTAPWFFWVHLATDGKWLEDFIFRHHLQRYLSGYGHREPFFYYLVNFPADFLPWTIFALPAVFAYRARARLLKEPVPLFLFLWFVVIFLFFSFSDTKRALYLLPIFPPAALFMACYFDNLLAGAISQDRFYRWTAYLFFNLLWLGALSLPFFTWFFQEEFFSLSVPIAAIVATGSFAAVFFIRQSRPGWTLCATALIVLISMVYASVWIFPRVDAYKSPKAFSLEVREKIPATEPLYIYADTMNDFNFYTEREVIPVLSSESEVENVAARGKTAHLLIRDRDLKRMDLEKVGEIIGSGRVGGKKWYLLQLNRKIPS